MKKALTIIASIIFLVSCADAKDSFVQVNSIGKVNKVLVVVKSNQWAGAVGDEIRDFMGEIIDGLPQPETILSVAQVDPKGYNSIMKVNKSILILQESSKEKFVVKTNAYAAPQTVIYVSAKDEKGLIQQLKKYGPEIIKTFREADLKILKGRFNKKKVDDQSYKTLKNIGISLTIPKEFKTVDDTGEFLWLRQHLLSGIARGDGTNNILVYTTPLVEEDEILKTIMPSRDTIGKRYIPGSREGMYMITEAAYTPITVDATIAKNKAFETRGKW